MEWALEQAKVINGCGYRKQIIICKQSVEFKVYAENKTNALEAGGNAECCPNKSSYCS